MSHTVAFPSNANCVWSINDHEFFLDLQDAGTVEHCEAAFAAMGEREKALPKDGKTSVRIRAYCQLFRDLFDDVFGEGSAQKIYGDTYNARIATEVYENFLDFMASQQNALSETQNRITVRYNPNRAQRRAAGKK